MPATGARPGPAPVVPVPAGHRRVDRLGGERSGRTIMLMPLVVIGSVVAVLVVYWAFDTLLPDRDPTPPPDRHLPDIYVGWRPPPGG